MSSSRWTTFPVDGITPRDEVLLHCLEFLDVEDLVKCAFVSKRWRRASYSVSSWKFFCRGEGVDVEGAPKPAWQWRELFIEEKARVLESDPVKIWPRVLRGLESIGGSYDQSSAGAIFRPDIDTCDALRGEIQRRFSVCMFEGRQAEQERGWLLYGDAALFIFSFPRKTTQSFSAKKFRVDTLADAVAVVLASRWWRVPRTPEPRTQVDLLHDSAANILLRVGREIHPADVFDGPVLRATLAHGDGNFTLIAVATATSFFGIHFDTS